VGPDVPVSDFVVLNQISSSIHPCGDADRFKNCLCSPPASPWILSHVRRCLEVLFAVIVLIIFAVPMLAAGLCIRLTSHGPALFAQERVGMRGRLFRIYKLRSMTVPSGETSGPGLTRAGDSRVTFVGGLLRKFKFDELPQFYNVLRGEMSMVGPRPKLPQYAAIQNSSYRPGITGPATIAFRHEEELIGDVPAADLDAFYDEHIKPVKARLDVCYMCKATPLTDLRLIAETILGCIRPALAPSLSLTASPVSRMRAAGSEIATEKPLSP
jgi:lipopolysaccharide/colanic/teichoic acid biosynthesis glycosyltransferase